MKQVDLCIIATLRPDLLYKTLTSFNKNMFYGRKFNKVILNVDCIGPGESNDVTKEVAKFMDITNYRVSNEPNFAAAVKHVWNLTSSKYVFHLEDDWLLKREIDPLDMINVMDSNPELACLRLCKYDIPNKKKIVLFDCNYNYVNNFFVAQNSLTQFGLNPCLIRRSFINQALFFMSDKLNPEKQFRPNMPLEKVVKNWKFAIYGKPGWKQTVKDIGRQWRKEHNYCKTAESSNFITWHKTNTT